ncbi:MAG: ATPase domain-containing protein [Candidatus Hodarchaeota archaeon]
MPGFDEMCEGGLVKDRVYIVVGEAGSGKTVFGLEFLYNGATKYNEPGILVSFEEEPDDIRANAMRFGWDLNHLEKDKKLFIGDLSPRSVIGSRVFTLDSDHFDLSGLHIGLEGMVKKIGAKRVVLDPISVLFLQLQNAGIIRRELALIGARLGELGCTTIYITEKPAGQESISRFGVEEFVAHGVILLSYKADALGARKRYMEILKLRGTKHVSGRARYVMISGKGLQVFPSTDQILELPKEEEPQ